MHGIHARTVCGNDKMLATLPASVLSPPFSGQIFCRNLLGADATGGIGGNVSGYHRHSGLRSVNKRKRLHREWQGSGYFY